MNQRQRIYARSKYILRTACKYEFRPKLRSRKLMFFMLFKIYCTYNNQISPVFVLTAIAIKVCQHRRIKGQQRVRDKDALALRLEEDDFRKGRLSPYIGDFRYTPRGAYGVPESRVPGTYILPAYRKKR